MPAQGSTSRRGYGTRHQRLREQLKPIVKSGQAICWRCEQPIGPEQPFDLGHDDDDRTIYRGPEHALKDDCAAGGNRAAGARKRHTVDDELVTAPPCDNSRVW
ncbi:hypothetical protein [Mycolicibacterium vaccae]|uniref:hypothetical protein n=1 Tax=Mycolicibacterium vaccae TaxID=1810 RepID=UPI003CFBE0E6